MSSNLIKAFSISYDRDTIKKLDFSSREESIFEKAVNLAMDQNPDYVPDASGFKAGILPNDSLEGSDEEPKFVPLNADELEHYKEQIREEEIGTITEEALAQARNEMAEERERIISEATAEAERIREAAVSQGKSEAEAAKTSILQIASAQGYEDGRKRAREEENVALAKLEAEKTNLQNEYNRQVMELEPAFVEILKQYVKKITGIAYDNHLEVLTYLIDCGINRAPKDTEFVVKLSICDHERLIGEIPDIVSRYEGRLSLDFEKDPSLQPGEIKLENKERVLNCGLGEITEGLFDALDMLAK